MTLFTRIGTMLIAGVAFGAPFSAAADATPSFDATSVSLSAVTGAT